MYQLLVLTIFSLIPGLVLYVSAANVATTLNLKVVHHAGNGGPAAYRAALLKHGLTVPPGVEAAAKDPNALIEAYKKATGDAAWTRKRQSTGSAPALPFGRENGYYAPITVGKSTLNLLVDTGSSDLWVYSDLLPKNDTKGRKLYNTSSGTRLPGYTWKIKYGDGTSAGGIVYRDAVAIGSATATAQAVEAATSVSSNVVHPPGSGILGLAYKRLNQVKPEKQNTLWENLNPTLKDPVFATDFYYNAPGTLDFGFIDPEKHSGPITYVRTTRPNSENHAFWNFNFTSFLINGTKVNAHPYMNFPTGLLDTGTGFTRIHQGAAKKYWALVKGAKYIDQQWLYPCDHETPDFGIEIGGRIFYILGKSMKQILGDGICYGGLQGFGRYDAYAFMGDPLINSNYVVFDGPNHRIGFAHKRRG